jgi:hypothetical protein
MLQRKKLGTRMGVPGFGGRGLFSSVFPVDASLRQGHQSRDQKVVKGASYVCVWE